MLERSYVKHLGYGARHPVRYGDSGEYMAAWVLGCPACKSEFKHAKIIDTTLSDYLLPPKPTFPDEGLEMRCPNCANKTVYQQHELVYRS